MLLHVHVVGNIVPGEFVTVWHLMQEAIKPELYTTTSNKVITVY